MRKANPQIRKAERVTLCDICYKNYQKYKNGCDVLTYRLGESQKDECFAFTDDPSWEKKVNAAVMEYARSKGFPDYVPIGMAKPTPDKF